MGASRRSSASAVDAGFPTGTAVFCAVCGSDRSRSDGEGKAEPDEPDERVSANHEALHACHGSPL